jgi:hypothetical protein
MKIPVLLKYRQTLLFGGCSAPREAEFRPIATSANASVIWARPPSLGHDIHEICVATLWHAPVNKNHLIKRVYNSGEGTAADLFVGFVLRLSSTPYLWWV